MRLRKRSRKTWLHAPRSARACFTCIRATRTAPHVSLGLTTGAWVLPDVEARLAAIAGWNELPDLASVNFDEEGCERVAVFSSSGESASKPVAVARSSIR